MKSLISILAGMVRSFLAFTYFRGRMTCDPLFNGSDVIVARRCLTPLWNGVAIRSTGSGMQGGPLLIAGVAGLLVGLMLWAVWARR
jgi:hypothetical protein